MFIFTIFFSYAAAVFFDLFFEAETETAVYFVEPNYKAQYFCKTEPKNELKSYFVNCTPSVISVTL